MSDNTTTAFFTASKKKLRFHTNRGQLSVEDLWDLTLKSLDELAVSIDSTVGKSRKTFLSAPDTRTTAAQAEDELRLEILKAVITAKQDENTAKREAADKAARKAFLKNLLEKKKIDALESLSAEEIEKELAALG